MNKPHKKLDAWKLSMDLVIDLYEATEGFPREERYSLTDQVRRAAVSVPSNIATFLHVARGSLSELDTLLEIAKRLQLLAVQAWTGLDRDMERIDKMISGLIRHQRAKGRAPRNGSRASRFTSDASR